MKNIFIRTTLFILLVVIASCKKNDPAPANNTTTPPPSPYVNDSIKISNTKYLFTARTNNVSAGYWRPTGTYNSGNYTIFIYTGATAVPTSTVTFQVIAPQTTTVIPPLTATQAYIYIMNSATYESWQGGTMVCTVSGSTIHLQITGMTVSTTAISTQYPLNMYLTLP